MTRAVMEGVGFGGALRNLTGVSSRMIVVGGGSKSPVWRQILSEIYDLMS
ncbi:MAG: hypothetical protein PQJ61_08755 [Spirochaetales bacterium]|uniref:Uncharacterized protein n=1 Tax=Candidatus Thalassospirochaeta sargassi TaxID=3119039 RepID=A0AAJ1ICL9_9SPIO|nr:hypothetical protein [Spirochaetales bacterium]